MSDETAATSNPPGPGSGSSPSSPSASEPPASPSPAASSPSPASPSASPSSSDPRPAVEGAFEGLGRDFDDDFTFEIAGEQTPAQPTPSPATQEAQPPVQPAETPPVAPVEAAPQSGTQQPAAPAAASPAAEPKSLVEQFAEKRNDIIGALAAERFALSKEEEEAFDLNPSAAVPQLMSRVYYEAVTATLNHINNLVPHMIHSFLQARAAHDEVEKTFYGRFPALDRVKHMGDVTQFAKSFRAANQQITQDDLFAMVGAAVMAKYGLSAPAVQNGMQHQPAPSPVPQPPPYVPAVPGASVRVTPEPESPWAGLGKDHDD